MVVKDEYYVIIVTPNLNGANSIFFGTGLVGKSETIKFLCTDNSGAYYFSDNIYEATCIKDRASCIAVIDYVIADVMKDNKNVTTDDFDYKPLKVTRTFEF